MLSLAVAPLFVELPAIFKTIVLYKRIIEKTVCTDLAAFRGEFCPVDFVLADWAYKFVDIPISKWHG